MELRDDRSLLEVVDDVLLDWGLLAICFAAVFTAYYVY